MSGPLPLTFAHVHVRQVADCHDLWRSVNVLARCGYLMSCSHTTCTLSAGGYFEPHPSLHRKY